MNAAAQQAEAFPPGTSNATTDDVILGRKRIADVPAVGDKPKRVRKPSRKPSAEYQRGFDAGMETGQEFRGVFLWAAIFTVGALAYGLGAWIH